MGTRTKVLCGAAGLLLIAGLALRLWPSAETEPGPPPDLPGGWAEGIDGAWGLARASDPRVAEVGGIEAIGYAGGFEAPGLASGLIHYDRSRATPGWNLYSSGHGPEAFLMDMEGKVRHSWRRSWSEVPGAPPLDRPGQDTFRRVELLPGGDLLAVYGGRGLVRLNSRSEVVWSYHERAHHDIELLPGGDLWTLIRAERLVPSIHPTEPIYDDYAVRLSPAGRELERHSILDALLGSPWASLVPAGRGIAGDILHTNSIRALDGRLSELHGAFAAGSLLLCVRELDLVCVLDPVTGQMTYGTQGPWRAPHDPTVTEHGLLLFDNLGHMGHSRAVEFDMRTGDISWSYSGDPPAAFSSLFCGAARRLDSGNTLLTESTRGRAFEVTPAGDIVWEYLNPRRAGRRDELVAAIFEMRRLPADQDLDWL